MRIGDSREFAAQLLEGLKATPFVRVAVACGKDVVAASDALWQAAFDQDMAAAQVNLAAVSGAEGFFRELSVSMGCWEDVCDVEGLLTATARFYQPRLVVLGGLADAGLLRPIINAAQMAATVSRDLAAPIRFVWLHDASQTRAEPSIPYEVWPAEWRDIPQIAFSGDLDTVLRRAFAHYLDRRVYWEAAGQGDRISCLIEMVLARANFSPNSRAVDETLDRIFDMAPLSASDHHAAANCLADPACQGNWIKALTQTAFPIVDRNVIQLWNAAGLIWRPPGMSRWRITPMCVRILAEDGNHPVTIKLGQERMVSRLAHARANPQISQMALVLATQIEAELLDALRSEARWEALIEACAMRDDIEKNRQRSQRSQGWFFKVDGGLLDYATFGQLVRLVQEAGEAFQFPLSRELLWNIASVRNLAAHGHPVRWEGMRSVVEAVFVLGA